MKKRNIFFVIIVIVVLIIFYVIFRMMGKVTMYSDEHIKGNSSCNLLNGGLVCEVDDTIYFANPYSEGDLYKVDGDLQNAEKVINDNVSYLNIAGKYAFYTKRNDKKEIDADAFMSLWSTGLNRLNVKTKGSRSLYQDPTQVLCLYGNNVYYQHYDEKRGLELYSVKIDGSEEKKLLEEPCAPSAIADDVIYYTGMSSDHAIRKISIHGGQSEILLDGNFTGLSMQGNNLYFLDMNDNYALKRMDINGGTVETLVSERIATYNVHPDEDVLYCQIDNGTDNGLYELNIASHALNLLEQGNFNYLHLTSDYLFYETYDQSDMFVLDLASKESKKFEVKED